MAKTKQLFPLKKSGISIPDLLAFALIFSLFIAVLTLGRYWTGPLQAAEPVELSLTSLPYAAFFSLSRIAIAYVICLISSIAIGYWAAHSRIAEMLLVPLIDIGQSIPVLGFLPGLVLTFLSIFPESRVGLEIAAILTLYTGMAWNLMLSFYGSIKTIPREYLETIRAYGYGRLGILLRLELPFAMNGLIWNSMLSIAGGWFFLTVCESYTLGDKSFRLLGLGSFMAYAAEQGNIQAMISGIVVMILILFFTDHFFWNPLLRWSERFQKITPVDDTDDKDNVMNFFKKSKRITNFIRKMRRRYAVEFFINQKKKKRKIETYKKTKNFLLLFISLITLFFCVWGIFTGADMVASISQQEWILILINTGWSMLRVFCVLLICTFTMVPLGLWLGSRPELVKKIQPFIQIIAAFPAPMIFPILILLFFWLSIPISVGSILLMMTGAQWYLLFNVISGSTNIPSSLIDVAKVSGMSKLTIMQRVYLPAAFPQILTGLITAAGGAWNTSIVAELVFFRGQEYIAPGLGSYIAKSASSAHYAELVAAIFVMVVVIVLLNRFFWAKLYNLAESKYRLD